MKPIDPNVFRAIVTSMLKNESTERKLRIALKEADEANDIKSQLRI